MAPAWTYADSAMNSHAQSSRKREPAGSSLGRVRDMPSCLRPREEMEKAGPRGVPDDALLAILLRSGVRGLSVVDVARSLLRDYGSLSALAQCSVDELAARRGVGRVKAQVLAAAMEIARRISEDTDPWRRQIREPSDVAAVLRSEVMFLDREHFWVLILDTKNRLKGRPERISAGLLDASLVHPREVFQEAIRRGAAAVMLAHNHPSGDPTPSAEDIATTRQLLEAGRIVDIRVLDHVILGKSPPRGTSEFFSMRENGVVTFS